MTNVKDQKLWQQAFQRKMLDARARVQTTVDTDAALGSEEERRMEDRKDMLQKEKTEDPSISEKDERSEKTQQERDMKAAEQEEADKEKKV